MKSVTQTRNADSPLKLGNNAMRQGDFVNAVRYYTRSLKEFPGLSKSIAANLAFARQKYCNHRVDSKPQRAAVCGWINIPNTTDRVNTLVKLYETFVDVEIIVGINSRDGIEMRDPSFTINNNYHLLLIGNGANFIEEAIDFVIDRPYDIIHLIKPLATNLLLGILYKLIWNTKVLVDFGKNDINLLKNESLINNNNIINTDFLELKDLLEEKWVGLAARLSLGFDCCTFSEEISKINYAGKDLLSSTQYKKELFISNEDYLLEISSNKLKLNVASIDFGLEFSISISNMIKTQTGLLPAIYQNQVDYNLLIKKKNDFNSLEKNYFFTANNSGLVEEKESGWNSLFSNLVNFRPSKSHYTPSLVDENASLRNFGASFLGPVLASFFSKFGNELKDIDSSMNLNFLAREGYFLESVYKKLVEKKLIKKFNSNYLLCSRTFLFKISLAKPELWPRVLGHHYAGNIIEFFKNRFAFTDKEIVNIVNSSLLLKNNAEKRIELPLEKDFVLSIFKEANSAILNIVKPKLRLYLIYLEKINFGKSKEEHVVDLGYAGTIQTLLSYISGVRTTGHYFITTKKATNENLTSFKGYIYNNISFGDEEPLLDRSLYLESLLTAPHGSVVDIDFIDNKISFLFGMETTAQNKFNLIELIVDGAVEYVETAMMKNIVMNSGDLSKYYGKFVSNAGNFPTKTWDLFEMDDAISGFGVINPFYFFNKV
ncbi:hypothetical protein [Rhodoferax sp. PAMC 29310]|uniref:hypothetical protein n=1 Tax=Rhodoferax sp. PAMC 29310 TaxID=2822760 RepID=UPI001B3263C9|nr:hypothetical protein [Rhodoferax sp. PAMC 29310]